MTSYQCRRSAWILVFHNVEWASFHQLSTTINNGLLQNLRALSGHSINGWGSRTLTIGQSSDAEQLLPTITSLYSQNNFNSKIEVKKQDTSKDAVCPNYQILVARQLISQDLQRLTQWVKHWIGPPQCQQAKEIKIGSLRVRSERSESAKTFVYNSVVTAWRVTGAAAECTKKGEKKDWTAIAGETYEPGLVGVVLSDSNA